jgi:hypothetical protein
MKPIIVASFILVAGFAGPAFAGCGNAPSTLDQTQLNTILSNHFACARKLAGTDAPGWNELHNGGPGSRIIEQHDPGATDDEDVGSWSTALVGSAGRVTYSYTGGNTPVYEVAAVANGNCSPTCTTLPQTYQFCGVGGGAPTLNVLVTATATALSGCPSNP